jgi:hypothetical protein
MRIWIGSTKYVLDQAKEKEKGARVALATSKTGGVRVTKSRQRINGPMSKTSN